MSLHSRPPSDKERQSAQLTLQTALLTSLPTDQRQWLSDQLALVAIERSNRSVDIAFGLSPRRLHTQYVAFSSLQKKQLSCDMPGWNIDMMSTEQAARMLVLSCFQEPAQLAEQITRLLRHADLAEQLAIYKGLPLYPPSDNLNDRLADGLRSNISVVFEAIAHNNPYPAWHLDTHRYNHMVLKALFIESRLKPIVGLEQRSNPELARMLMDTARERIAASRPVSDELWPLASPYMNNEELKEFNLENAA